MTSETILVTGATGKTGRRIVEILERRGREVRAVSRSTPIPFDWSDESTWDRALANIAAMYVMTNDLRDPAMVDTMRRFADRAVRAGATRAVMASVPKIDGQLDDTTQSIEQQLVDAGLELTVLRLRWFNQNFSEDFLRDAVLAGAFRVPAGHGGEAFVDADDIAEVAVTSLLSGAHGGRDYELTGPRVLTFADVAHEIEAITGRTLTYTPLGPEEYADEQRAQGAPDEWIDLSTGLYASIASGELEQTTSDVEAVLGRPARDFSDFIRTAEAAGAWR